MNGKMLAFIFITSTIGLASAAQSLEVLATKRDAFLVANEKIHPDLYLGGLTQDLNRALLRDPVTVEKDLWLDYLLDHTKKHAFLDGNKDETATLEQILEKRGIELVEDGFPAIGSEKFKANYAYFCTGNGYLNQIRYTIGFFGDKVGSYVAAKSLGQIRAASVGQSVAVQEFHFGALTSTFSKSLIQRIDEYVDHCYKPDYVKRPDQPEDNYKENVAILISNRKKELGNFIHQTIAEGIEKYLATDFAELTKVRNFLHNLYPKLNAEINYLTVLAMTDSTKIEEVWARVHLFGEAIVGFIRAGFKVKDSQKGFISLDADYIASIWAHNFREAVKGVSVEEQKVASKIFHILMRKLSAGEGVAAAKKMADKIYGYQIPNRISLSGDAILKAKIDERPFTTNPTDLSVEALRAWDHIVEGSSTDESFLQWFASIAEHYHEILAVPSNQLVALNVVRRLFKPSLLPQTETEVWKALYQAITQFIAAGTGLATQEIGKNFDTFLDKHYAGHPLYVIMKLMNLNSLSDGRFPIVFPDVSEETLEHTAKLMDGKKDTYTYLYHGFNGAYRNLGLYDSKKGTPATVPLLKAVIAKLNEKEVLADEFKLLNKGQPFNLII